MPTSTYRDNNYAPNAAPYYDNNYEPPNKHLPIVLCLDISPSMKGPDNPYATKKRWELQNDAVEKFLCEIARATKSRNTAEIAFIAFSDKIVCETDFMPLSQLNFEQLRCEGKSVFSKQTDATVKEDMRIYHMKLTVPVFEPVSIDAGTHLSPVLNRAVQMLEERRRDIKKLNHDYYTPFLVLTTDCDHKGLYESHSEYFSEKSADIAMLQSKCDDSLNASEMIVPFIVGIGSKAESTCLREYSAGFRDGYIPVPDETAYNKDEQYSLSNMFRAIAQAIADSTTCKGGAKDLKELLSDRIADVQ